MIDGGSKQKANIERTAPGVQTTNHRGGRIDLEDSSRASSIQVVGIVVVAQPRPYHHFDIPRNTESIGM